MTDLIRLALFTAMEVSAPLLGIAMVVGLSISVFQSVTQINEMTLTFVPKILIFALVLIVTFPWMLKTMMKFTNDIIVHHWANVVSLSSYTS